MPGVPKALENSPLVMKLGGSVLTEATRVNPDVDMGTWFLLEGGVVKAASPDADDITF